MTPPAWSSRDAGRSEIEWVRDIPWASVGRLDLDALVRTHPHVIVIAPHPDDETLAVGGLIAALVGGGTRVDVLLLTDGEGSHPGSPTLDRETVGRVRRAEFDAACGALEVNGDIVRVQVPDGAVSAHAAAVDDALRALLQADAGALVIAPWTNDGHADHEAAGRAAQDAAEELGAACVFYPLWAWHWASSDEFDWQSTVFTSLPIAALEVKERAVAAYASQTSTFGQPVAEPALLHPGVMRRFERLVETLIDPDGVLPRVAPTTDGAAVFDAMFDETDDPWGVETRWYERRRRAIIEAVLPREALGRVLDIGCSTGVLTAALAPRATSILAVDQSERALAVARRDRGHEDVIEWRHVRLPDGLDDVDGPFDLIVLSEVGYFFDGCDLLALFAHAERILARDGAVVTANWQHPTRDIPLDGRLVDRQFCALWPPTARYEDADVVVTLHDRAAGGEK